MDNSTGFQSSQKVTHKYNLPFIPKTRIYWVFTCKKKKFVYRVNEYSIPQVTNRPMYNIASAVTRRTLAIVRSLPLPGCDICRRHYEGHFYENIRVWARGSRCNAFKRYLYFIFTSRAKLNVQFWPGAFWETFM